MSWGFIRLQEGKHLEAKPVTTTLMDMAITDCMPYTSVSNKLSGSKIAFTLGA
jgi:hypothetical protein